MGALLERRTDYEDKNRNRKTRKRNDFTDLQYFHNLSVCMDDFKCTENKGGDYGCQFIFPAEFQWHNFYQVIFESPLLRYVGNSLFVSVITLALQIVTGAMIAYAIVL